MMTMTMMMHFFSDADASRSQRVNRHASRASRSLRRTRTDGIGRVKRILFIVSTLFAVAQSQSDASSRWVRVFVRSASVSARCNYNEENHHVAHFFL